MTLMTGGQALVHALAANGVDAIFGVPGLHTLAIYDALYHHPQIRTVVTRHEGSASMMADGYARATGRPGVCLTIPGPGVANALAGIAEAFGDSSPVLLLAGQIDTGDIGQRRSAFHEYRDQSRMIDGVAGWRRLVTSPDQIPDAVVEAFEAMTGSRPQPAVLEMPRDVAQASAEISDASFTCAPVSRPAVAESDLLRAVTLLSEARFPLILAGQGVIHASATGALVRLAEALDAPVITTSLGRSAFPGDHPLSVGYHWSHAGPFKELLGDADLLFALGTDLGAKVGLGDLVPLPPKLIHLDLRSEVIGRHFSVELGLVGDAGDALRRIAGRLEASSPTFTSSRRKKLEDARIRGHLQMAQRGPLEYALIRALRDALPRDAIITQDACLINDWLDHAFPLYEPRTCFRPSSSGTLGFALPAALGAKVASPERVVVAAVGDGGFLFTAQELATARKHGLNLVILLFNDNEFRTIRYFQGQEYAGRVIDAELHNPDFLEFARAFDCEAERVENAESLRQALSRALHAARPTLIELPLSVRYPVWLEPTEC